MRRIKRKQINQLLALLSYVLRVSQNKIHLWNQPIFKTCMIQYNWCTKNCIRNRETIYIWIGVFVHCKFQACNSFHLRLRLLEDQIMLILNAGWFQRWAVFMRHPVYSIRCALSNLIHTYKCIMLIWNQLFSKDGHQQLSHLLRHCTNGNFQKKLNPFILQ